MTLRNKRRFDQKQKLLEDSSWIYSYDQNGNLASRFSKTGDNVVWTYIHDSENRMRKVEKRVSSSLVLEAFYLYDPMGRRIEKRVFDYQNASNSKTRRYVYDGESIYAEMDGNNEILAKYTHSGLRIDDILAVEISIKGQQAGLATTEGNYYFIKDRLGSITGLVNDNKELIQKQTYSAFGTLIKIEDENGVDITANPLVQPYFSYTGREFDKESGLYYYRARYYDSYAGRFIEVDPDPGELTGPTTFNNKFIYACNSPINVVDPNGKFGFIAAVGITLVYTAAISAIQAKFQKGKWSDNFLKNWAINFSVSMVGLGAHGLMTGFNAQYALGWGGVYSGAATGASGFSVGFFQSTPGVTQTSGALYWHEVGHTINYGLFNTATQGGNSMETRIGWSSGFYAAHGIGSYGGQYNPVTAATEGGADVWSAPSHEFAISSGYQGFGPGVQPFVWW